MANVCSETADDGTDQCDSFAWDGQHWPRAGLTYNLNLKNSGDDGVFLAAIQASSQTWEDDPDSDFDFTFGDTTGRKASSLRNRSDGNNDVTWDDLNRYQNPIAVTVFWYFTATEVVVEADLINNKNLPWTSCGNPAAYDVQHIDTHEFGHYLVLGDLYDPSDSVLTMYGYGAPGNTHNRTLGLGDQLGIRAIYPSAAAVLTGAIGGTVTESGGTTPISGATVSVGGTALSDTTATGGSYSIADVPEGTHSVTASDTGFVSETRTGVVVREGITSSVNFALAATPLPPPPELLSITLAASPTTVALKQTVTLSGRVTDQDGGPVEGATVSIVIDPPKGQNLTPSSPALTDASGNYSIGFRTSNRTGAGTYSVTASANKGGVQSNPASTTFEATK